MICPISIMNAEIEIGGKKLNAIVIIIMSTAILKFVDVDPWDDCSQF